MPSPELPANEEQRLQKLHSLAVLDSGADPSFDDICELARHVAGTEIAIISLVDRERQWFKSCVGLPLGQLQSPRSISFCAHTIMQRQPLIIEDALLDVRFAQNPLVIGDPGIRFYAGVPLITDDHYAVGSLCVISRQPHRLDADQIESLARLAGLTVLQMQNLGHSRLQLLRQDGSAPQALPLPLRDELSSLQQLIGRDQMLQMLDLILAMQSDSAFALLRCRYRDYERVSATLGGLEAETFLNEAARRLIAALPREATVARFADAELVALLPSGTEPQAVARLAERIIALAGQAFRSGQHSLSLAVSIGIVIHNATYQSVEAIVSDTGMAVQMARRNSASSFRFIDADARVVARESYRLESDLRDALHAKSLEVHLQPIVDLSSGDPLGFEALARWRHGDQLLLPESFIPTLAESGITAELDLLILEKALAAMPLLARPVPQRPMQVNVNLSGLLLEDSDQRQRLLALIADNPCPPGWTLQVEILEDAFHAPCEAFDRFLAELVGCGVLICIDDFGTGYSSLARLISLPIQGVKLDRAFVQKLDASSDSGRTLLRTMIAMLQELGLGITAEGVETPSQRAWLRRHGVGIGQGYLFHRPIAVSEAIGLLESLNYRPRALAVDPRRFRALGRQLGLRPWRFPFGDRRRKERG